MRWKLASLDLANCRFDELPVFLALLVGNCGLEVLNLRKALAYESHHGNIRDSPHPGIADQLRINSVEVPFSNSERGFSPGLYPA